MRIEYELTYSDALETQAILQAAAAKVRPLIRVILSFASFIATIGFGLLFGAVMKSAGRSPSTHTVFLPLVPWIIVLALSLVELFARSLSEPRKPWEATFPVVRVGKRRLPWKLLVINTVSLTFGVLIALLSSTLLWSSPAAIAGRELGVTDFAIVGFALIAISSAVYSLWAAMVNYLRNKITADRRAQAQLSVHYVAQASDAGITVASATTGIEYSWSAFAGYLETQSLILLFTSPDVFVSLPKRAFASPWELDGFCTMVSNHIATGRLLPRPTGFAVIAKAIPVAPA